jgi:hypothetical protein
MPNAPTDEVSDEDSDKDSDTGQSLDAEKAQKRTLMNAFASARQAKPAGGQSHGWKALREQAGMRTKLTAISLMATKQQDRATGTRVPTKTIRSQVAEWEEIGTDGSDTEQIDRLTSDLKTIGGGGTFDPELCEEYNNLERIITRFLKVEPATSAIFAICQLQELDMEDAINQLAFLEIGGLRPLLEIVKESPAKIAIGACQILNEIIVHPKIQVQLVRYKGVAVIVNLMRGKVQQLQTLAAEMYPEMMNEVNKTHEHHRTNTS